MKTLFFLFIFSLILANDQFVRVCLIETNKAIQLDFKGFAILFSEEARYQLGNENTPLSVIVENDEIIFISSATRRRFLRFKADSKFYLQAANTNSKVIINQTFYENTRLDFRLNDKKRLQIIATVPLEAYVKYVVPNEIRTSRKEEIEAIKAQSVAARTYVLNNINKYKYFDVYADVRDQMYRSSLKANQLVDEAISITKGQILTYKGELINAQYCSSLGGIREYPYYLKDDDSIILSMYYQNKFLGQESNYYRWKQEFSLDHLIERFEAYNAQNLQLDTTQQAKIEVIVLKRSSSGRVETVSISIESESIELKNFEIRQFFRSNKMALPSTLFYLEKDSDKLVLYGGGFGHGQGMGQWEAIDLAKSGVTYQSILSLFYPKTDLRSL